MFSKKLALFIVMSLLAAAPAFAAGVDVHTDTDAVSTDGHVDRPDQKDHRTDDAATRKNEANNPEAAKDEANRVKALTADHMTTNPTGDRANSDIQAKINAVKTGAVEKAAPVVDTEVQALNIEMTSVGANTAKDAAANQELKTENPANFANFEANVAGGQAELAKIKDPTVLARARKMLRALRDSYIAMRLNHTGKSVDYWRDAIVTYARSVAGDNWAAIEEGAARLMAKDPSLTEQAAKLQAAKDYIKEKHPNMRDDIVDEIAKEIVIQKSCV